MYNFIRNGLLKKISVSVLNNQKAIRQKILASNQLVLLENLGAVKKTPGSKTIGSIAKLSGIRNKYGKLLYRTAHYFQPKNILELGTNLGLSTFWIKIAVPQSAIFTIEGQQALHNKAKLFANEFNLHQIKFIHGYFDSEIPHLLTQQKFDMVFIDGNHTYNATMRYFEMLIEHIPDTGLLIFDDIYWSAEMAKAWKEIKNDARVQVSIDLFQFGLIFKNQVITRGNYRIRY